MFRAVVIRIDEGGQSVMIRTDQFVAELVPQGGVLVDISLRYTMF